MRVAVVLLVVASLAAVARADAPDVGVVAADKAVRTRVQDWVRKRGYVVVTTPLSKDATNTFDNCFVIEDVKCAAGVFEARARSASVIYVGVDAEHVTLYWFVKDREPTGGKHPCAGCNVAELLDRELDALARAQPELPVTKVVRPSKLWPTVLLGTGIATLATGGVFLYYGLGISGADEKYVYPPSTPIGLALAAVGGGATIGGIILLKQAGSSSSGPVASVSPGGGFIGWAGRF